MMNLHNHTTYSDGKFSPRDIVVELSGPEAKIEAFISLCRPYGIREVVRSGPIALMRGAQDAGA